MEIMKKELELSCPFCTKSICHRDIEGTPPSFCPMPESEDLIEQTVKKYTENETVKTLALNAARTEAEGYCEWTRIEEIIHFARRMDVKTIGIAHCAGLMNEARIAHRVFKSHGFEVHSICCKVGKTEKTDIGLEDAEKIRPGEKESACNPIAQAMLLENAGCELNVVIGLCVGHDSLFFMHSNAPVTVLVAKDRVTGHNPAAVLYTHDSYYRKIKKD